ncbi:hypothetical protein C8T65DRAFT_576601 [Cerioporus squamosus]|nr:hypothetical protein C8T65DRAFT_576601 [Cerioporus squamosus]
MQETANKKLEKKKAIGEVLEFMSEQGVAYGEVLEYMSDVEQSRGVGHARYDGLFAEPGRVERILENWVSSRNTSEKARKAVVHWIVKYVSRELDAEGNRVTKDGFLLSSRCRVNAAFAMDFNLLGLYNKIKEICPLTVNLLGSLATSTTQQKKLDCIARGDTTARLLRFQKRHQKLIASSTLTLLHARSQRNSYFTHVLGLYLYATGAQRQTISVLSHLGLSSTYQMLASDTESDTAAAHPPSVPTPATPACAGHQGHKPRGGLLHDLSESCRDELRTRAQAPEADPLADVYDNINFMFRAAEQIIGKKDSQENGTCATAFTLFDAPRTHMQTADVIDAFEHAPPLAFKDIRLTSTENAALQERLIWTVANIAVQHGGEGFTKFKSDLSERAPTTTQPIPLHKTEIFPMPAMNIDESSTVGNAAVLDAMFTEMGHDVKAPEFNEEVRIVFGDQLSMARVRGVTSTRVGHDDPSQAYLNVVFAPGFFHYQMAATYGVLETHWGDPTLGQSDPGSLYFHNTRLDHKPILLSSLPPYRTCRDLTFVSLYARVLTCLELAAGRSLHKIASECSFDELYELAGQVVDKYADPSEVHRGRQASSVQEGEGENNRQGDTVYANAVLFLRDALLLRHFADAIKSGHSDHIVTVLKLWALGFRAMGRTKYAHELLFLIHNIVHVWPPALRDIIMKNWLVNITGNPNAFIPVDLLQEHMNYWIKVVYQAHGSNASWEWLATISPCIHILRQLATQVNTELGSHQGTKHHAPDLSNDIRTLMDSLRDQQVYVCEGKRQHVGDVKPVPNVFSAGIHSLSGPLADYNKTFEKMRARRAMTPLVGQSVLFTYGVQRRAGPGTPRAPTTMSSLHDDSDSESDIDDETAGDAWDGDAEENLEAEEPARDILFTLDAEEDVDLDMDGY